MTVEQIEQSPKEMLTCSDVAEILCAQPYTIHLTAEQRPELLGFPVIIMGRRVKIPRRPFLKFIKGE